MTAYVRFREAMSCVLWHLHAYGTSGWWDAGTDVWKARRGR